MFLFGDQSCDLHDAVLKLQKHTSSCPSLASFLNSTHTAILDTLPHLTIQERARLAYQSLAQLSRQQNERTVKDTAAYTLLGTTVQLGLTLLYAQKRPEIWQDSSKLVFGVCTGEYAALALKLARNEAQFLQLSPYLVSASLRAGVYATRRAESIETGGGAWAAAIPKVSQSELQTLIDDFVQRMVSESPHIK